jgi:cell division protein FtsN
MARDYKPRQAPGSRSGGGTLLGFFVGFILGLVTAAAIAIYVFKTPVPFLDKPKPAEHPAPAGQILKDAPKAAQVDDGKPRFDFYRILPGQEEPVSSEQLKQAAAREKAGKGEAEGGESYFLQAGSFQSPADADNLKARIAFLGLESSVEPTNTPDKGVSYRVRVGPFGKVDEINKVRSQLAQNGIDVSLVKLRSAGN